jgi:hypothetical protein
MNIKRNLLKELSVDGRDDIGRNLQKAGKEGRRE